MSDQRVLIVDDNDGTRRILESILRVWGVREIRTAEDGACGLQVVKSWAPTLVITDWNMRAMDGWEFLTRLRQVENGALGKLPVLVVTAHSSGPVVKAAHDAGANQIVVKPIVPKVLFSRLWWVLRDQRRFVAVGERYVLTQALGQDQALAAGQAAPSNDDTWYVD